MYQYKESGLSNIWLLNGYQIRETDYGEAVSVEDAEELHAAIGRALCSLPRRLKAEEVRFLRKELGLSQRRLANVLDVEELTVGRWERGETEIPGPADRLLRALYAHHQSSNADALKLIQTLAEIDRLEAQNDRLEFEATNGDWQRAA